MRWLIWAWWFDFCADRAERHWTLFKRWKARAERADRRTTDGYGREPERDPTGRRGAATTGGHDG
ncbi:hypothetical protein [Microbaculum marinum]|uniref:Uncharacterized protein n=1 Tax=Microbaculum marinum TaxID=1764581 RepID=A0AAW9RQQ1_9HYPH